MILYCAADLIWATKIKGTADALGVACRPVRNLEMLEARLVDTPVRALIVDLESGDTGLGLIQRIKSSADASQRSIKVVVFGPHVAVDRLQAARAAGADSVMARGAFNARLPEVLKALSGGSSVADDLHE